MCDHLRQPWVALVCQTKLVWVRLQKGGDLHFDIELILCNFILGNVGRICMVSKSQDAHKDVL